MKNRTNLHKNFCVKLAQRNYDEMMTLESLSQVGAYVLAVTSYAFGTSLDFAHAIADCTPTTRKLALRDCTEIWQRKNELKKKRGQMPTHKE